MTDPAPFLAAVRAGDFFAALAFADWLEERGRGREAALLRRRFRRWERERAAADVGVIPPRVIPAAVMAALLTRPDSGLPELTGHWRDVSRRLVDRRFTAYVARVVRKASTATPSAPASRAAVSRDGASSPRSRRAT